MSGTNKSVLTICSILMGVFQIALMPSIHWLSLTYFILSMVLVVFCFLFQPIEFIGFAVFNMLTSSYVLDNTQKDLVSTNKYYNKRKKVTAETEYTSTEGFEYVSKLNAIGKKYKCKIIYATMAVIMVASGIAFMFYLNDKQGSLQLYERQLRYAAFSAGVASVALSIAMLFNITLASWPLSFLYLCATLVFAKLEKPPEYFASIVLSVLPMIYLNYRKKYIYYLKYIENK